MNVFSLVLVIQATHATHHDDMVLGQGLPEFLIHRGEEPRSWVVDVYLV